MERKIFELFLYNHKLKFSDIEKLLGTRSNKIAYHLKKLVKKNFLEKEGDSYKLSEKAEAQIPYLTNKKSVISVILIALQSKKKIFFIKRNKRPFDNKLCLPGGRLIVGETVKKGTERIMMEKFGIKCKFEKTNSIHLEHVKKNEKTIHSFLLIFVSAKTKDKIDYTSITGNKNHIVSSDYYLIKNDIDKKTKIENLVTRQKTAGINSKE